MERDRIQGGRKKSWKGDRREKRGRKWRANAGSTDPDYRPFTPLPREGTKEARTCPPPGNNMNLHLGPAVET